MSENEKKRSYSLDDYTAALDEKFGAMLFEYGDGEVALTRYTMASGKQRESIKKALAELGDVYGESNEALKKDDTSFDFMGANDRALEVKRKILGLAAGDAKFTKWLAEQPEAGVEWLYEMYQKRTDLPEASSSPTSS